MPRSLSRVPHTTARRTCFSQVMRRLAGVVAMTLMVSLLLSGGLLAARAQSATPATAAVASDTARAIAAASAWLQAQQAPSGGFPGYSSEVDPGTTTDAVIALYAAEASDPDAAAVLGAAVRYLETNGAGYAATGPGQAAKLALAAVAGGKDARHFAGLDLVAAMTATTGTPVPAAIAGVYGDDLYDHALVLLALAAAGETVPDAALEPLRATQTESGGWAFDGAADPTAADSNTTALAIQALVATGHGDDPMIDRGLAFLATLRASDDSGFAYGPADPLVADGNSTALVIQALIAAGADPSSAEWGNAPAALARLQTPSGGVRYMASDDDANLLATLQAIPALAGLPLPVARACAAGETAGTAGCLGLSPAA
jgi:hypothetical protein